MKVFIGKYPGKRAKDPNRDRTVRVRIDPHDVWGLDNTLAHIIHPALVKLREVKHGAPETDDDDVPEELRSTSPKLEPPKNEYDSDGNHFLRWDWVLDEMIWAFEQLTTDGAWEDQFHTGVVDFRSVPELDEAGEVMFYKMEKGPDDTHVFDKEGWEVWAKRIANGCRLFGKYYQNLWD